MRHLWGGGGGGGGGGSHSHTHTHTQVQEQHESGTHIKLDVSIEAPEIVIPLKSDSDEVVLADLGKLKLSNSFFLVPQEKTAIAEV